MFNRTRRFMMAAALGAAGSAAATASAELTFDQAVDGLEKVVTATDGAAPLYELYRDEKKGRLLAVLPKDHEKQLIMIACTISGGDPEAGVMGPTHYARWKIINEQLALVAPNLSVRTEGDAQAKDSIKELYTDRVMLAVPVLARAADGRPVIDLGHVAVQRSSAFFGPSIFGSYGPSLSSIDPTLARLTKTKAFPKNVIVEYEVPRGDGRLVRLSYAIGALEGTEGFKPRKADARVGYFYNWHQDFARPANDEVVERYITRWNLEKADPKLARSPAKQPIVWYIEHTTPVRFRRYVRDGILMWNEAFEEIGILNAIEVYQQDAQTGAHIDKDPEDARYNFFRWNTTDQGYAIGPSRTNPYTGEILDADVVWHQGLTRSIRGMLENLSADLVEQSFSAETLAWLDERPSWDPRVRLAGPARQQQMRQQRALDARKAVTIDLHAHDHPWTHGVNDPTNTACRIGNLLSADLALADAAALGGVIATDGVEMLDGLPEPYIGQMIRYISAHEVGHCLGFQHNMAASSLHALADINREDFEGPMIGSVMDYTAANINYELGEVQGPYATTKVGPYDKWAIAFGYGPEDKVQETLARVSEPGHLYVSQIAMSVGSDPRNMTWDLGDNNLEFAESRIALARSLRAKLVEDVIKDGESWLKARQRFNVLLGTQLQAMFIAQPWVGGTYINNDFKGDPGGRPPIGDVPADEQRRALQLIIGNGFDDDAFGLTPELIRHLGREYWYDPSALPTVLDDPSYSVHDTVGGIQATALTLVMNPTTLRRVYDNEFRTAGAGDVLTVSEVITTITDAAWGECLEPSRGAKHGAEAPMISSFRRNLQREHVGRLIDLALLPDVPSPAVRTIATLATAELRRIDAAAAAALDTGADPYSAAHLADVRTRIARALEAAYVITP